MWTDSKINKKREKENTFLLFCIVFVVVFISHLFCQHTFSSFFVVALYIQIERQNICSVFCSQAKLLSCDHNRGGVRRLRWGRGKHVLTYLSSRLYMITFTETEDEYQARHILQQKSIQWVSDLWRFLSFTCENTQLKLTHSHEVKVVKSESSVFVYGTFHSKALTFHKHF